MNSREREEYRANVVGFVVTVIGLLFILAMAAERGAL